MKNLLKSAKNVFKKTNYGKRIDYILNFNQRVNDEFIISIARKNIGKGSRILDIGAGPVRYKKYFKDCAYLTQDFQQYKDPAGKFKYGKIDYVSDILDIPVQDNSFDAIICTEVLEHVEHPMLAIKEFSRILKPEGKLYITAPLCSGVHQSPYHFYSGFSGFWYKKFLKKYGFKKIVIKPKKKFFALYSQYTQRALMFLTGSKKIRHVIFRPIFKFLNLILPIMIFRLDKQNLDDQDPLTEFTIGYFVKARKK